MILRDHLALERTRLPNERTVLAYTRSSCYLVIGGLALVQLEGHGDLLWVGLLSLVLSAAFFGHRHRALHGIEAPAERILSPL